MAAPLSRLEMGIEEFLMASNEPQGSPKARYSPPSDGPFACHACSHFRWPHLCDHPKVIQDSAESKYGLKPGPRGLAVVAPGGCCEYFRKDS